MIAIQAPGVQTRLARTAISMISDKIDGKIVVGKIHANPFKAVVIKDIAIIDNCPYSDTARHAACDTLFRAKYITATFSLRNLLSDHGFCISTAHINDARMYLSIEPGINTESSNSNLKRIFRLGKSDKEKERNDKDVFSISKVKIENMAFVMDNFRKDPSKFENGINWFDMEITDINISGRKLKMKGPVMSGICEELSFREKSGYVCHRISGRTTVGNGKTEISDFKLADNWSVLSIPDLTMTYENTDSWSEFVSEVKLDGDISPSTISIETLEYFAPSLAGKKMTANVKGHITGYVNNLHLNTIDISTYSYSESGEKKNGIKANIGGSLKGLPDVNAMLINANVKKLDFTTSGLEHFIQGWAPASKIPLGKYCKGENLAFIGKLSGRLDKFQVSGQMTSAIGKINTDLKISNLINKFKPMDIEGNIETVNLDVKKVIGSGPIGECSLRTGASALIGKDTTGIRIDSLFIDKLNFNNYDYSGISALGMFNGKAFDGRLVCNDPNLNFLFQGIFTFSTKTKNAIYQFYANLGYADLHALNFDKRGTSKMSLRTTANFTRISGEDIIGNIDIQDIVLTDEHGIHDVGDIGITSHSNNNLNRIRFNSGFAEATYVGNRFLASFIRDIQAVTTMQALPSLYPAKQVSQNGNYYDLSIKFHDSGDILSFFAPGTYIAANTAITVNMDKNGKFNANAKSGRIAYRDKYIKDLNLTLDNRDSILTGRLRSDEISVSPLLMKKADIGISAHDDSLSLDYKYDNGIGGNNGNRGDIRLAGRFSRDNNNKLIISGLFLPSNIRYDQEAWNITSSVMTYSMENAKISGLDITSDEQSVSISGGWSAEQHDTLTLALKQFDLSILNSLTGKNMGIGGKATGKAMLISPTKDNAGILMNILSDSTSFANRSIGTLRLASVWDDQSSKFNIVGRNDLEGRRSINLIANYYPKIKEIEGGLDLDGMDIGYAEPFLNTIFSDIGGAVSGKIRFHGAFNALEIESRELALDQAKLKVGFTGVEYIANGPVTLNSSGVVFDNVSITDKFNAKGNVTGHIGWNHFKDMQFGINLGFNDIQVLDIKEGGNPIFYGNLYASGTMGISGPLDALLLSATATTTKSGSLHIPLGGAASASVSNLLTFKEPERLQEVDPYEEMMKTLKSKEKKSSDFSVRLNVTATPEVEADIEIDKTSGNVLTGSGNGLLDLDINPSKGRFNINGNYNITRGNYHFVALGIAKRDFSIQDGSSIRFNGDIMESDLDIDAVYKTKASVGTLIADTTSTSTRRAVECMISITDKIRNPRLGFSINIPDLDPTTQARVESALNTQDKVQKQLLALLITNSFIPDEPSGVTNRTSSTLYSNVTEIMAGQLNNILQKLNIPLDFGLDYQQNMSGTDIFDVALSTALFNNRVIVNGTVGNREYDSGTSGSEFVGDLDIDVKLTKSGALRLNLFSHSADQYTNYLDNSQRNGLGFTYQKEYDRVRDFFKNLFKGRKKREEAELARQQDLIKQEKTRIVISSDDEKQTKKRKDAR